jgi:hypothetical protein
MSCVRDDVCQIESDLVATNGWFAYILRRQYVLFLEDAAVTGEGSVAISEAEAAYQPSEGHHAGVVRVLIRGDRPALLGRVVESFVSTTRATYLDQDVFRILDAHRADLQQRESDLHNWTKKVLHPVASKTVRN